MTEPDQSTRIALDDLELLLQLSQVFRNVSDSFSDRVEIPRGQAMVLCQVAKQDGLTQSEIAERLSVQGATITTMLQKMDDAGWVSRQRDAADNRLVRVYMTEAGIQKEREINEQFGALQTLAFKEMSQEELALLRRWLLRIIESIA